MKTLVRFCLLALASLAVLAPASSHADDTDLSKHYFFKVWTVTKSTFPAQKAAKIALQNQFLEFKALGRDPMMNTGDYTFLETMRNIGQTIQTDKQLEVYNAFLAAYDKSKYNERFADIEADFTAKLVSLFVRPTSWQAQAGELYMESIKVSTELRSQLQTAVRDYNYPSLFDRTSNLLINFNREIFPAILKISSSEGVRRFSVFTKLYSKRDFKGTPYYLSTETQRSTVRDVLRLLNEMSPRDFAVAEKMANDMTTEERPTERFLESFFTDFEGRFLVYKQTRRYQPGVKLADYAEELARRAPLSPAVQEVLVRLATSVESKPGLDLFTTLIAAAPQFHQPEFIRAEKTFRGLISASQIHSDVPAIAKYIRQTIALFAQSHELFATDTLELAEKISDLYDLQKREVLGDALDFVFNDPRRFSPREKYDQLENLNKVFHNMDRNIPFMNRWPSLTEKARRALVLAIHREISKDGVKIKEWSWMSQERRDQGGVLGWEDFSKLIRSGSAILDTRSPHMARAYETGRLPYRATCEAIFGW